MESWLNFFGMDGGRKMSTTRFASRGMKVPPEKTSEMPRGRKPHSRETISDVFPKSSSVYARISAPDMPLA